MSEHENAITEALKPFGWTFPPDFKERYDTDVWVHNLVNAVVALTAENKRLRESGRLV